MRSRTIVICAVTALGVSACGSAGSGSASLPAPPAPVVLSALVSGARVSLSPARIGAGPVLLTVTNQGHRAAVVTVLRSGRGGPLARTAPLNPQGVTQIKVDLGRGAYRVAVALAGRHSDVQKTRSPQVAGALLTVGARRAGGGSQLLGP